MTERRLPRGGWAGPTSRGYEGRPEELAAELREAGFAVEAEPSLLGFSARVVAVGRAS